MFVVMMLGLSGCANLLLRPRADYNGGPYCYTSVVSTEIERGFNGKLIEQFFLPVLVLDWPLDAVVDTVFLPYDAIAYRIRMKSACKSSVNKAIETRDPE